MSDFNFTVEIPERVIDSITSEVTDNLDLESITSEIVSNLDSDEILVNVSRRVASEFVEEYIPHSTIQDLARDTANDCFYELVPDEVNEVISSLMNSFDVENSCSTKDSFVRIVKESIFWLLREDAEFKSAFGQVSIEEEKVDNQEEQVFALINPDLVALNSVIKYIISNYASDALSNDESFIANVQFDSWGRFCNARTSYIEDIKSNRKENGVPK